MQNTQQPRHALASLLGWTIGGSGFLLSLALALTVLVRQGNPGFLAIWLVAAIATFSCLRAQARWRKSCERMYAPDSVRTYYPARKAWKQDVEDIDFRDVPNASMSFSQ